MKHLRVHVARLIRWLSEPTCGTCRQRVDRCTCEWWWTDPL